MNMANDGSLNRHGGQADMESNADEQARERAEAVEERMALILVEYKGLCPECNTYVGDGALVTSSHLATCELLRARAEREVDAAERAKAIEAFLAARVGGQP